MPVFLTRLLTWTRHHPGLALLGGLVATGGVVYANLPATPLPARAPKAPTQAVPGLGIERASAEAKMLKDQRDTAELREVQKDQQKLLREIQQAQAKGEQEQQAARQAQEQKLDAFLKQAQAAPSQARPAPTPRPAPRATPAPRPGPLVGSPEAPTPAPKPAPRIQMLRPDKTASFVGQPPSITRGETPYLPAGSFAEGRVLTGIMATSRAGGALPILFAVTKEFTAPFQLQVPGRNPVATALPIQGCFILGKASADLGASRVIIQLELLSCVFNDGATFEQPIRGYATDKDGTLGIVARVETHDSAVIAKAALTGIMAGAAEALKLAKQTTLVTPLGGTISSQNGQYGESAALGGLANTAAQLSQFYLAQAGQLLPTLWVESNVSAKLVLQEGVALEGLPLHTIIVGGK
jgi:hypothetical protein